MHPRSELYGIASLFVLLATVVAEQLLPVPAAVVGLTTGLGLALAVYSIVLWRREQAQDPSTRDLSRRYLREFMPAMLAYVVAVALSVWLLGRAEETWLRALIALLPVAPIAIGLRATARYIRGLDEMQRRIELEAVALASLCVSMVYMTGGLLQSARVTDINAAAAMLWVLPSLTVAYAVAKRLVARHYG